MQAIINCDCDDDANHSDCQGNDALIADDDDMIPLGLHSCLWTLTSCVHDDEDDVHHLLQRSHHHIMSPAIDLCSSKRCSFSLEVKNGLFMHELVDLRSTVNDRHSLLQDPLQVSHDCLHRWMSSRVLFNSSYFKHSQRQLFLYGMRLFQLCIKLHSKRDLMKIQHHLQYYSKLGFLFDLGDSNQLFITSTKFTYQA